MFQSIILFAGILSLALSSEPQKKCEQIKIPMCQNIGYNITFMPNQFHHFSQEEAGLEVHQFWPLVKIHCSADLRFFLCSLYVPVCVQNYDKIVLPCRSVCERAKSGCAPLMKQYGFSWPERMECKSFPEKGDDRPCIDHRDRHKDTEKEHVTLKVTSIDPVVKESSTLPVSVQLSVTPPSVPTNPRNKERCVWCACENSTCSPSCYGPFKKDGERRFIEVWITVWAVACFISTVITILTLCIDRKRFNYPELPIIYMSVCSMFISLGFLTRAVAGHEAVACTNSKFLRHGSNGPPVCTIVFMLIFFFWNASLIWWVLLNISWFLSAALKWSKEAISHYKTFFHLAAWSIPTLMCVVAFSSQSVDGDPVSGICSIGNTNSSVLIAFVIVPLCVYITIGLSFLMSGLISLFRIRAVIKMQEGNQKTHNLEKLMIRIGLFSLLFSIPTILFVACSIYEVQLRGKQTCACSVEQSPDFSVFMLKFFMLLFSGVVSGFWIWTRKTLESWKYFMKRVRPKTVYTYPKYTHYQSSSLPLTVTSI